MKDPRDNDRRGDRQELDRQFLSLWIIWAAMLSSLVIYVVICHLLEDSLRSGITVGFSLTTLRNILLGVSVAELLVIHSIRRAMTAPGSGRRDSRSKEPRPLIDKRVFMARYMTTVMVTLAIAESIGVYGLVLFLLGGGFNTLYIFILLSALAMVAYRPNTEEFETFAVNHLFR